MAKVWRAREGFPTGLDRLGARLDGRPADESAWAELVDTYAHALR